MLAKRHVTYLNNFASNTDAKKGFLDPFVLMVISLAALEVKVLYIIILCPATTLFCLHTISNLQTITTKHLPSTQSFKLNYFQ